MKKYIIKNKNHTYLPPLLQLWGFRKTFEFSFKLEKNCWYGEKSKKANKIFNYKWSIGWKPIPDVDGKFTIHIVRKNVTSYIPAQSFSNKHNVRCDQEIRVKLVRVRYGIDLYINDHFIIPLKIKY